MQGIRVQLFRFRMRLEGGLSLPPFAGATIRGGFGYAFRRVACPLRREKCDKCALVHQCVYAYIFETPRPHDAELMRLYPTVPHPFILRVASGESRSLKPGETLSFDLTLIGRARLHLSYFIFAFEQMGRMGIGRDRCRAELLSVHGLGSGGEEERVFSSSDGIISGNPIDIELSPFSNGAQDPCDSVDIDFISPVRLKFQRHFVQDIPFHVLVRTLMRRVRALDHFHGEGGVHEFPAEEMIESAETVSDVGDLQFIPLERFSSRQQRRIEMGGLVGHKRYRGNIGPFLELLRAGEFLHVGKGTAFGLGRYAMSEVNHG